MASSLFLDLQGQPISESETLGYGRTGVVIHRDRQALKIPLRHPWSSDPDVEINVEVIRREQDAYRRLNLFGPVDGVVSCTGLAENAIQLARMEGGDLRTYLEDNRVSRAVQVAWLRQMARALEQIHARCILVADIATRNFLLDSNLSLKLCDFSEASVLPLGTCMEAVDDNGFSVQTDIGQLGAVMYEVTTGQKCDFDLFRDNAPDDGRAAWPQRASLPSTDGLWLGWIIEKCWTEGAFRNARCLSLALEALELETPSPGSFCFSFFTRKHIALVTVSLGVLMAAWFRRQYK